MSGSDTCIVVVSSSDVGINQGMTRHDAHLGMTRHDAHQGMACFRGVDRVV